MKPALFVLFFVIVQTLFCQPPTSLRWRKFTEINTARIRFEIARIAPDNVLIFGGYADTLSGKSRVVTNSVEILDLRTGVSTYTTSMVHNHAEFASILLPDSNVIAVAGKIDPNSTGASGFVELFDKKTKKWRVIGNLVIPRFQHEVLPLDNDRFIVVGGRDRNDATINSAEIFTISTGQSVLIENYPVYVNNVAACITSNGKIAFLGGREGGSGSGQTDIVYEYDVIINRWKELGRLHSPSVKPSVLKLKDQNNLIVGGFIESSRSCLAEIHIEEDGVFSYKGNMGQARYLHSLAQYNSNYSLVMGGLLDPNTTLNTCEWIDNVTGKVYKGNDLLVPRYFAETITWEHVYNGVFQPRIFLISGSATDGTDFVSKATKTVEVLEIDTLLVTNPPSITAEKSECGIYTFDVSDKVGITDISLDEQGSDNCTVNVSTSLPAKKVTVAIFLKNDNKSGRFKLLIRNNGNKTTSILNTIKPKTPIELGLDKKFVPLYKDSIPIGHLHCISVPLINKSDDTVNIEKMYMVQNTYFSIPETSKQKFLLPNDTAIVKICYYTYTSYESIVDTLIVGQGCNMVQHPFVVRGMPVYENDDSKCDIPLVITQYKSKQNNAPTVFYGDGYVKIIIERSPNTPDVYLYDMFGTQYLPLYQSIPLHNRTEIRIDTSVYLTGVYYMVFESGETTHSVPVLISH